MSNRKKKILSVILVLILISSAIPVFGKEHAARLKECIKTDYMYFSCSIRELNGKQANDKNSFKKTFDGDYIVVSGEQKVSSISKNKKEVIIEDSAGNKCTIDTSDSEVKKIVETLKVGDQVNVYGKLDVKGIKNDSYEIVAKKLSVNTDKKFANGNFVFFSDEEFNGTLVDDLTLDKSVEYYVPSTWQNSFVCTDLTNNGIKGHQYSLNAISPQNTDYPEIFYIFFFNYETYLEKVPTKASDGDNKDIEVAIVRNILEELDEKFKIKMEEFKDPSGTQIDYFSTTYRPKDRHDYRLEFMFRPGKKGITCMLYLYYPSDIAVNHLREVAYLVETLSVE